MYYQIFCKYHQHWNEYEIKESEFHGGDRGLILGCHWCNNYWIVIDHSKGIRDGVRDGYESNLTKEQLDAPPKFSFTQEPRLSPTFGAKEWLIQ